MKKAITVLKFIYLYVAYWLVGLTEEDFYISKGNYFADLGKYYSAIKYYKKALQEDELFSLYASIGWCYAAMENNELALKNYRKAYEKIKRPEIAIVLAHLEIENGDSNRCKELLSYINAEREGLDDGSLKLLDDVQKSLARQEAAN